MLRKQFFEENDVSLESAEETIEQRIAAMEKLDDVNDKSFNAVNWQIAMDHIVENDDKTHAKKLAKLLTSAMGEVMEKAVKQGSLADGDVPSKDGRDRLMDLGLMTTIAEKGEKRNAVTMIGFQFWELSGGAVEPEKDDDKDDEDKKDDDK